MDVHDKLDEVIALLEGARSMPMSGACIVNRGEALALLDDVRELLPEEFRHAELLLADREAVVEEGRREAGRIVADAEAERARLVDGAEVVAQAHRRAQEILSEASSQAHRMRRETEDYVDLKLEGFEVTLNRTLASVHRGRQKLREGTGNAEGTESARSPEPTQSAEVAEPAT